MTEAGVELGKATDLAGKEGEARLQMKLGKKKSNIDETSDEDEE